MFLHFLAALQENYLFLFFICFYFFFFLRTETLEDFIIIISVEYLKQKNCNVLDILKSSKARLQIIT